MTPEPICSPQLERALEDALRASADPWEMQKAISRALTRAGLLVRNERAGVRHVV